MGTVSLVSTFDYATGWNGSDALVIGSVTHEIVIQPAGERAARGQRIDRAIVQRIDYVYLLA